MSTTKVDIIEGHSVTEEFGIITEVVRRAHVKEINATASGVYIAVLNTAGVLPTPGDAHPADSNLILGPRIPSSDGGNNSCFVDLVYRTKKPILRGGTYVSQITTQRKRDGTPIKVSYTNAGGPGAGDEPGESPQVVEINPFNAETSIVGEVLLSTTSPGGITETYVNKLNVSSWQGYAAKRVYCSQGNAEPWVLERSGTKWWRFTFEFQVRELREPFNNAWQPEAAWVSEKGEYAHDPDPGDDTDGLVMVDGWYELANFNTIFP